MEYIYSNSNSNIPTVHIYIYSHQYEYTPPILWHDVTKAQQRGISQKYLVGRLLRHYRVLREVDQRLNSQKKINSYQTITVHQKVKIAR